MRIPVIPKIASLDKATTRYRVAYGGRGSGKSYGVATMMVKRAITDHGARFLCTRETQNSLSDSSLAVMKRVINDYNLNAFFEQTRHGLVSTFGSEFIFRGLQQPDRIKSLESVKYCWISEAQRVTEDAFEMLIPTIRTDDAEIWIDFNPDSITDPVFRRFVSEEREDVSVEKVNFDDNPYFPDSLETERLYDMAHDIDRYRWIWEGEVRTVSEALVFRHKFVVKNFLTPEDADFYFGIDWGFSQDPTAMVRCYIHQNMLFIDYEAYQIGCEIDDTPALFDTVPGSRKWRSIADNARPETISYVRRRGFNIHSSKKGKGSVEDGIEYIKSFDKIVIHPRCKHTIDEFSTYSYERDRLTGEPTPKLEDKNNHCIDALRYALEPPRRGRTVVELSGRLL